MYASAFCGVMTMFATVGVASANTDASPIICAVTPAEFTPFHVLLVVVTTREIRRHGLALDELVRMMVGALLLTPGRARGWSFLPASPRLRGGQTISSSPGGDVPCIVVEPSRRG